MVTHFVEVAKEDCEVRNELNRLPKTTMMLYDMVLDSYNGVPVFPVHSELIFSMDESSQYVCKGHKVEDDAFRLVVKSSCERRGTNAMYKVD